MTEASNAAVAANKAAVTNFFETTNRESYSKALEQLDDTCVWWMPTGTVGKAEMTAIGGSLADMLDEQLTFEVGTMTAEEDRVAVEIKSHALRKNGRRYANVYHFLFWLRNGRIVEVREHCDTAHARDVWSDMIG